MCKTYVSGTFLNAKSCTAWTTCTGGQQQVVACSKTTNRVCRTCVAFTITSLVYGLLGKLITSVYVSAEGDARLQSARIKSSNPLGPDSANDDGDAVEVEIVGMLRAENARQAEEILELRAKID